MTADQKTANHKPQTVLFLNQSEKKPESGFWTYDPTSKYITPSFPASKYREGGYDRRLVCHLLLLLSEKLGLSRNGRMERNFPLIPIFRNFRPISWGTPKISEWNLGKCLFHSLRHPEFSEVLVEWDDLSPVTWFGYADLVKSSDADVTP